MIVVLLYACLKKEIFDMGLFNSIMKGMGFSDNKNQNSKNSTHTTTDDKYSNFDNGLANSFVVGELNQDSEQQGFSDGVAKNLIIYAPKDNNDIRLLVECLRRKEACIVNLGQLNASDADKILQFISGAVYALKGSIKRLQGDLFLMVPEGINIMTQANK